MRNQPPLADREGSEKEAGGWRKVAAAVGVRATHLSPHTKRAESAGLAQPTLRPEHVAVHPAQRLPDSRAVSLRLSRGKKDSAVSSSAARAQKKESLRGCDHRGSLGRNGKLVDPPIITPHRGLWFPQLSSFHTLIEPLTDRDWQDAILNLRGNLTHRSGQFPKRLWQPVKAPLHWV